MAAWRYEISLFVLKYFSTLEEKFRISARPCNIVANDQQTITAVQSENSSSSFYLYFMYVPYFNFFYFLPKIYDDAICGTSCD